MKQTERTMSQPEIAEKLGVSPSTVERDQHRALAKLRAIAKELKLSPEQIENLVRFG